MAIYYFEDGKIVSNELITDRLGFLQQLDVLPVDMSSLQARASVKEPVYFIDKFAVPDHAKKEFYQRMNLNRKLIKQLPGFIEDHAYEYHGSDGNLIYVTVAEWASHDDLMKAKDTVQAEYKREGFDPGEMMKRLGIKVDRGVYLEVE